MAPWRGFRQTPMGLRSGSARVSCTVRMWSSASWLVLETRASCQRLRVRQSSLIRTMLSILRSRCVFYHFWCSWREWRYSFFQRHQNSFARCWTRLQCLLEYMSAFWKFPGGGSTISDFIINRWFGVRGAKESGSARPSTVRGLLLMIASASHMNVLKDSSSSWFLLFSSNTDSTLRTLLIWRSQTPPMWLAEGTFILKLNQSQLFWKSSLPILSWSSSPRASLSSSVLRAHEVGSLVTSP